MSVDLPYVDTSALAKWYISEPGSERFEDFVRGFPRVIISRLTMVELRCLLARRHRTGDIASAKADEAFSLFESDVRRGHLDVRPLQDEHALIALDLLRALPRHALRTLDVLHLAIVQSIGARSLATADRRMARAAEALGVEAVIFG